MEYNMDMQSPWERQAPTTAFPKLENDITVDVAIIGGGITGITAAQLLKEKGYKVAVLESLRIAKGSTGKSTGNLYTITEYSMAELEGKYSISEIKQIVESRRKGMDFIRGNVQEFQIDCNYKTQPMFIFENDDSIKMEKEYDLAAEIAIPYSELKPDPFPFSFKKGIKYEDQAQFNPYSYTKTIAENITGNGCDIYENSRVIDIDENESEITLKTKDATITANYIIHATHTPMGIELQYHTTLGPYREYGIAVTLKNSNYPEGIYWGHYNNQKYSIRSYFTKDETYLICVGSPFKVGQAKNNQAHIEDLITFVKQNFEVEKVTHRWGAQNYKPADLLPYIGEKSTGSKQYIATGFSADGLVYGVLAAMIICDEISDVNNPYSELYKASRHQPLKAAKKFAKENLNVAAQIIKDYTLIGLDKQALDLSLKDGKVMQVDGKMLAIYKDEVGTITALSAICPHMGCVVHWNNAEESWDCPCHGSRFNVCGDVIEGPAYKALEKKEF